jgi:hypothetical protein
MFLIFRTAHIGEMSSFFEDDYQLILSQRAKPCVDYSCGLGMVKQN